MAVVRARTYRSFEESEDPTDPDKDRSVEVTGELEVRHVTALDYDQHLVGGIPVDPETIEPLEAGDDGDDPPEED